MNKNQNDQEVTKQSEEKELSGNVIVVIVGCGRCPVNEEYSIAGRDESDGIEKKVGQVIECASCHGRWMLKRIQMRGVIVDAGQDAEEWRIAPLFIPILSSFDIKTLKILDAPVSMLKDKEDSR
jgi:hypothetical protein